MKLAASGTIGINQEEFWRQDLGVPFVTADARLSVADLDHCRAGEPRQETLRKPDAVVMGVDVGQDHFWVVIRLFAKKTFVSALCRENLRRLGVLNEFCEQFKVEYCVVDALPDTRGAKRYLDRAIHGRQHTYAFLCYYKQNGTEHLWDWGMDAKITAVRTLSLDEMFDGFRRRRTLLPPDCRELAHGLYYEHLQALVRTTEPDDFGQPVPRYRHTRPDDFAHAENYITLVATRLGR